MYIMNNQEPTINTYTKGETSRFSLINWINKSIEREQKNAIGISLIYVMVGSGIASLTAALSVNGTVSLPIIITTACLAMGTNAAVLSQQPFKLSTWFFIVSVTINTVLLGYQIVKLSL